MCDKSILNVVGDEFLYLLKVCRLRPFFGVPRVVWSKIYNRKDTSPYANLLSQMIFPEFVKARRTMYYSSEWWKGHFQVKFWNVFACFTSVRNARERKLSMICFRGDHVTYNSGFIQTGQLFVSLETSVAEYLDIICDSLDKLWEHHFIVKLQTKAIHGMKAE